jgi:biotin synthase
MTLAAVAPRHDWTREEIAALFDLALPDLMLKALKVREANWPDGTIQKSQLLSIKTGGCPEDCGYCSQSAHFKTGLAASKLMDVEKVVAEANGADRFCMGAAWRSLKDRDLPKVCEMISAVKAEGLETCVTLGMLEEGQAEKLKDAGLDYYNHNLDTSREYYGKVTSTRTYEDRLETLDRCRKAGVSLCCGGILGMGESRADRVGLIHELSMIAPHPESGHAARQVRAHHRRRTRAGDRCGAHRNAGELGASLGGPREHDGRGPGALHGGRGQLDLRRRAPADDGEPGSLGRREAAGHARS